MYCRYLYKIYLTDLCVGANMPSFKQVSFSLDLVYWKCLLLLWQHLHLIGSTVYWPYLLLVGSKLAISRSHSFYCTLAIPASGLFYTGNISFSLVLLYTGHTCFWLVLHWQRLLLIGSTLAIPVSHCSLRVKLISNWLCWLYLLLASSILDIQCLLLVGFGWFYLLQIGYFHSVSILYTNYTFF
jgi:hypothetical protein